MYSAPGSVSDFNQRHVEGVWGLEEMVVVEDWNVIGQLVTDNLFRMSDAPEGLIH